MRTDPRFQASKQSALNDHRSGYEGRPASLLIEAMNDAKDKWTVRFNGGESIEDVKQRMSTFLEKLKKQPYETVLVVSHGWVIHTAVAIVKDISNEEAWKIQLRVITSSLRYRSEWTQTFLL